MTETHTDHTAARQRKQRSDGARSRSAILHEAAQLATLEGIGGLSIGRLAEAVGMSKSGLFAHFGSKEELQLATIDTAAAIYSEQVIEPAMAVAPGLERLKSLGEHFLLHVEHSVFPGGCFFASVLAEVDTHPGPVRDSAMRITDEWFRQVEGAVREAQAAGEIDPAEDPGQLAFEIDSYLLMANAIFVATQSPTPMERARRAVERRLAEAAPKG